MGGDGEIRFAGSVDKYRTRGRGRDRGCHCMLIVDGFRGSARMGKEIDGGLIPVHIIEQ